MYQSEVQVRLFKASGFLFSGQIGLEKVLPGSKF